MSTNTLETNSEIILVDDDGVEVWEGKKFHLWGYENTVTWLYTDHTDHIIIEITPLCPLIFEISEDKHREEFQEWIKSYNPYEILKISQEKAQRWLQQTQRILDSL